MKVEFFPWKDEYSVQIEEIDNQHKVLVGILNDMYEAFMRKEHIEKMNIFIEKLVEYAAFHFKVEERYFKQFSYSEMDKHMSEHSAFTDKIAQYKSTIEQGETIMTMSIMSFLRDWLTNHIMVSDKKYVDCFHKNGIK
jgi:hemerythrin